MNLDPTTAGGFTGAGLAAFIFTAMQFVNQWKNRAVGQEKDKTYEARTSTLEKQNEKQTTVLDLQTNLLYEMRADNRARFDKLEGDVKNVSDQVKDLRERVTTLEAMP